MKKALILLIIIAAVAFYWTRVREEKPFVDPGTQYAASVEGFKDQITSDLERLKREAIYG